MKVWQVTETGSFIDGVRLSDTALDELELDRQRIRLGADRGAIGRRETWVESTSSVPSSATIRKTS